MFINRRICWPTIKKLRLLSTDIAFEHYAFEERFTTSEKERVLNVLNSSTAEELSKFNVTKGRLRNLNNWKNKKGPFMRLGDILEVEGLGVYTLDTLCQSILTGDVVDGSKQRNIFGKYKKNIVVPSLNKNNIDDLTFAVGLHMESTGVSWAKLEKTNNKLLSWNYYDFSAIPKKVLPFDTYNLALKIIESVPPADIYVLESKHSSGRPNTNPAKMMPYTHQLELTSMLLALINTRQKLNIENRNSLIEQYPNKVYYLRNRLPARLFGALVGTERVTTEATILDIINGNASSSLPCSQICVEPTLISDYCKCSKGYKDLLEQALLLVITFMELCVYNNPISHGVISGITK